MSRVILADSWPRAVCTCLIEQAELAEVVTPPGGVDRLAVGGHDHAVLAGRTMREVRGDLVEHLFDLRPSPVPAGEVHARSVTGIPQVRHRSAGTGPTWSGSVTAGPPRAAPPKPTWPAALGEVTR